MRYESFCPDRGPRGLRDERMSWAKWGPWENCQRVRNGPVSETVETHGEAPCVHCLRLPAMGSQKVMDKTVAGGRIALPAVEVKK